MVMRKYFVRLASCAQRMVKVVEKFKRVCAEKKANVPPHKKKTYFGSISASAVGGTKAQ